MYDVGCGGDAVVERSVGSASGRPEGVGGHEVWVDVVKEFVDLVGEVGVLPYPSRDGSARRGGLGVVGEGEFDWNVVEASEFAENMGGAAKVGR